MARMKTFKLEDIPSKGIGHPRRDYPMTVYKGVLVVYDEDKDDRIKTFIRRLSKDERENLLIAEEHEGCLHLVWDRDTYIPSHLEEGHEVDVEGDVWAILISCFST